MADAVPTVEGVSAPPQIPLSETLLASADCVRAVLAGQSLSECLEKVDGALRPSTRAVSFHAMRRLGRASAVRRRLVRKPSGNPLLDALLLVSLALLDTAIETAQETTDAATMQRREVPVYTAYTVVDQAVNAARGKLKPYRGLVNGVLRNFIRERGALQAALARDPEAVWNYPRWWIDAVKEAYPQQWQAVLRAGNRAGPMTLRVNVRRASVEHVLAQFAQAGISACHAGDAAIVLARAAPVHALPGFNEGSWSVQDLAAQRAGYLLPLHSGMRVLDACAAPGGKTAHLLERADIQLLALDADPLRLERVADNLHRLGLQGPAVELRCADASDLSAWWDGMAFDAVLADVPCTASGVVRRHPDIRWLRRPADIGATATLQRRIVDALWQVVRPGGHLLFVTCSIFPQEGEEQATAFCGRHADARRMPAPGQVLPLEFSEPENDGDGFFYALFRKAGEA